MSSTWYCSFFHAAESDDAIAEIELLPALNGFFAASESFHLVAAKFVNCNAFLLGLEICRSKTKVSYNHDPKQSIRYN